MKNEFVSEKGDFEFPNFLYHTLMSLMKSTLDLGTLACQNQSQLRAFKETTKKNFKAKWKDIAEVLVKFDLIAPCSCSDNDFCSICGGSRFISNDIVNSDFVEQLFVFATSKDAELFKKLEEGHLKALGNL